MRKIPYLVGIDDYQMKSVRKSMIRTAWLLIVFILTTPVVYSNETPNIILIISDDAGYADFGFTNNRSQVATPHLDKLAKEGVIFSQGYVSAAVCCPSRMGLMTGRYQQRFGAECNVPVIPTPGFDESDLGMDLGQATMGDRLKARGYRTMMIGKWHLGEAPPYHPLERGFDEFYGFLGGSRSYWPIEDPAPGRCIYRNRVKVDESNLEYLTDDLTNEALGFIDRNRDNRFFLYLSYNAPHTPMDAKEEDTQSLTHIKRPKRRTYAAMMKSLDENVGRIMTQLERSGIDENTMVVFVNDNGGAGNNASRNAPLRGTKGTYWEGGIRVPFFLWWKGEIQSGMTYNNPVMTLDLLPTFMSAAGYEESLLTEMDGVNLMPLIENSDYELPQRSVFWRMWRAAAVRWGPWKLIRIAEDPLQDTKQLLAPLVLVNLDKDPAESVNQADQYPEIVEKLMKQLNEWENGLSTPRWYDGQNWQHWAEQQVINHKMD